MVTHEESESGPAYGVTGFQQGFSGGNLEWKIPVHPLQTCVGVQRVTVPDPTGPVPLTERKTPTRSVSMRVASGPRSDVDDTMSFNMVVEM